MKLCTEKYQLRYAAGTYWLLEMDQKEGTYHRPRILNEGGAEVWRWFVRGLDSRQVAQKLAEQYGIPEKEILFDVEAFAKTLDKKEEA